MGYPSSRQYRCITKAVKHATARQATRQITTQYGTPIQMGTGSISGRYHGMERAKRAA